MRSLLTALALVPLSFGCAQAQVSISARSTDGLALSAEEAATQEGAPAGTTPQLLLHVVRSEVHVVSATADEADDDEAPTWVVVSDAPRDVDLVALSGTPDEIADGPVPAGKLTQVRLVLDATDPATLTASGASTAVRVPSGTEAGLKLRAAPSVLLAAEDAVELAVKVDGLVERGDDGWTLTPTLELLPGGS